MTKLWHNHSSSNNLYSSDGSDYIFQATATYYTINGFHEVIVQTGITKDTRPTSRPSDTLWRTNKLVAEALATLIVGKTIKQAKAFRNNHTDKEIQFLALLLKGT